jgi:hypothetical protein
MRRANGPTAKVLELARKAPGGVITWSEAQGAYACGSAAAKHKLSVSNVLNRHFEKVEGMRGAYVLSSMISNPDWDEDMEELQAFHAEHGADEFGMSTWPLRGTSKQMFPEGTTLVRLTRMSDIESDQSGGRWSGGW